MTITETVRQAADDMFHGPMVASFRGYPICETAAGLFVTTPRSGFQQCDTVADGLALIRIELIGLDVSHRFNSLIQGE